MKKVKLIQILLTAILLVAFVLLTGELFGQVRVFMMKIFVISAWVALVGNIICAVILFFGGKKEKKQKAE